MTVYVETDFTIYRAELLADLRQALADGRASGR